VVNYTRVSIVTVINSVTGLIFSVCKKQGNSNA